MRRLLRLRDVRSGRGRFTHARGGRRRRAGGQPVATRPAPSSLRPLPAQRNRAFSRKTNAGGEEEGKAWGEAPFGDLSGRDPRPYPRPPHVDAVRNCGTKSTEGVGVTPRGEEDLGVSWPCPEGCLLLLDEDRQRCRLSMPRLARPHGQYRPDAGHLVGRCIRSPRLPEGLSQGAGLRAGREHMQCGAVGDGAAAYAILAAGPRA